MKIIEFITANYQDIVIAYGGLVLLARTIVKFTPTPADDTFLEKVITILKHVGLVVK